MKQSPILTFNSSAFPIAPGEDAETNPGIFGRALAQWLSKQLVARGMQSGDAFAEDFGWCVGVKQGDKGVHVVCTNGETTDTWQVFCFTERGFFEKLRGRPDATEALEHVFDAVKDCLSAAPEVRDVVEEE
ncbi:MAG TPA: hypothetical protein VF488_00800 [Gemmatimonadaceae bacterium]